MGFSANKIYKLVFTGDDLAGLEVRARSIPIGKLLDLQAAQAAAPDGDAAGVQTQREGLVQFAAALVSWNLTDGEDQPVPATLDGLLSVDTDLANEIIDAWSTVIRGAPGPLEPSSSDGQPSAELSIPMETLSESQAS